jgi:hypothetical protein
MPSPRTIAFAIPVETAETTHDAISSQPFPFLSFSYAPWAEEMARMDCIDISFMKPAQSSLLF